MPKIAYVEKRLRPATLELIAKANEVIAQYQAQGDDLTLRQLYYQFVSRGWLANTDKNYDVLGSALTAGRMGGHVDWYALIDRTRYLRAYYASESPEQTIRGIGSGYTLDHWEGQSHYVEVWIEKDALVGVLTSICDELRVPYFSCRGYTSLTEMWGAAMRFRNRARSGRECILFHLGDHDPSGIDMTRDIDDRLATFGANVEVRRIALTMDQINDQQPPPNPAKVTDSRYMGYRLAYGEESWELDALEPQFIRDLVRENIEPLIDEDALAAVLEREEADRLALQRVADRWAELVADGALPPHNRLTRCPYCFDLAAPQAWLEEREPGALGWDCPGCGELVTDDELEEANR